MGAILAFLKGRLKEKSTWAFGTGIVVWAIGMFGFTLDAETQLQLTTVIGGLLGVVAAATKTKAATD